MRNCWQVTVVGSLWWSSKREDDGVRGIHQLSSGHQSTRSTDGLARVSVVRLAAKMDTSRCLAAGHSRVLWCPSSVGRGRRRFSRVGRSGHGVSGWSGVGGGPCEVALCFVPTILSFFSAFPSKKIIIVRVCVNASPAGPAGFGHFRFIPSPPRGLRQLTFPKNDVGRKQDHTRTFEGPGASNTLPEFHEKTPRERRKSEITDGRRKKARNFGLPTLRGPHSRLPHFFGFGSPPLGPHPSPPFR